MASLVLVMGLLLAAVFVTAGVGKLLDLPGTRSALEGFGVPKAALGGASVALPLAELAVALALLVDQSARIAAVAALLLLVAFMAGIAAAMSRGEAPDCHCFGQIHSAPAGRGTLARNLALALLAALVAVRGPQAPFDLAGRTGTELLAAGSLLIAALLAGICARLWLDNRRLRGELADALAEVDALPSGLAVGTAAPSFELPDLHGRTLTLEALRERGRPIVLVFATPDCGGCKTLLPDLGRWQASLGDRLTIAVVSIGTVQQNRPVYEEHGVSDVVLQERLMVLKDYRIRVTPSAVVVSADGIVASAPAEGAATIEPLVRLTLRRQAGASAGPASLQKTS